MKIYGIGTDIVGVDRIKNIIKDQKTLKRLFNEK